MVYVPGLSSYGGRGDPLHNGDEVLYEDEAFGEYGLEGDREEGIVAGFTADGDVVFVSDQSGDRYQRARNELYVTQVNPNWELDATIAENLDKRERQFLEAFWELEIAKRHYAYEEAFHTLADAAIPEYSQAIDDLIRRVEQLESELAAKEKAFTGQRRSDDTRPGRTDPFPPGHRSTPSPLEQQYLAQEARMRDLERAKLYRNHDGDNSGFGGYEAESD
jgi:hypothetical protein